MRWILPIATFVGFAAACTGGAGGSPMSEPHDGSVGTGDTDPTPGDVAQPSDVETDGEDNDGDGSGPDDGHSVEDPDGIDVADLRPEDTEPSVDTDSNSEPDTTADSTTPGADTAVPPNDVDPADAPAESDTAPDDADSADLAEDVVERDRLAVLFVGNSYIYTNDLPTVFGALAREAGFPSDGVVISSVTQGGYRLEQHAADARAGLRLGTLLDVSAAGTWDVVVLQEQSQIPGFPLGVPERDRSMIAVVELAELAAAAGAQSVLFETWGYRTGDARNSFIFPDYPTMQQRLTVGYGEMADAVASAGPAVSVAPVGRAFRLVWQAAETEGTAPGSAALFTSLYSGDNSHPARAGTYLAACVLLAQIADVDVRDLDTYDARIAAADRDTLQEFAMQAVSAAAAGR